MKPIKTILILGIGTLLLSAVGFYNGYPLVYSDTGTYIYSGFDQFVPFDRPISYGLFLWFFSFKYSAWLVVMAQNILTSFVIFETLKVFFKDAKVLTRVFLLLLFFLVSFTGIGWYSNQLMPDFFAPLTVLTFFTLTMRKKMTLTTKILLVLILLYSLISHFSHLMIGMALVIISLGVKLLLKERLKEIALSRLLLVTALVLSSWFVLPTINYAVEGKFTLSKGSHVFLMGHLVDTGILYEFLKENCQKTEFEDCQMCEYKDELPRDAISFIWTGDLLEKTGGWENSEEEYAKIINGTLTQPKYLFANLYKSFSYGLIQLTDNKIGHGLSAYNEGSAPYGQINWRFRNELNPYLNSRQNKWNGQNLNLDSLNKYHFWVLLLSLLIVLFVFTGSISGKLNSATLLFLMLVLIAIVLNSFVTAGLNSPYGRLQTRVVWLLPMAVIVLIIKNYEVIFGKSSLLWREAFGKGAEK